MCGIAGFLGHYNSTLLEEMNHLQAHRGPDDGGTWHDKDHGVGLAHRRLSIIDLSSAGHQPMWDANRQAVITFNGEIYNYHELRADLKKDGFQFNSFTDTEVVLNLYLRYGTDCLGFLNGIFAFSLWDARARRLLLARDGFGIKPLYYAQTKDGFVFASEIKSLMRVPDLNIELDAEALFYYVSYLYAPCPHSPLKAVRKFRPGHAAWVGSEGIEKKWQFYHLPYDQPVSDMSEVEAEQRLRLLLDRAVQRQMVADVPVGAFLSGGLDSSSIVAFARKYHTRGRMDCFTIGFKEGMIAAEGMADDLPYAQQVAEYLDVNLHTVEVGAEMALRFEEMVYQLDEPQADPAPLNALFICELARKRGIKVLLSGAGGDDVFSGYRRHFALSQEIFWEWLPLSARKTLQSITQLAPADSAWGRRISKAFRYAHESPQRRLASYFLWIEPHWLQKLAGERLRDEVRDFDPLGPMMEVLLGLPSDTPRLNQMLALDASFFLTDHNLNYTDKMSMATGVEVRVPFLDPDLVAFAASLPPKLKQRGKTGKWIFKRSMESLLPREVIYRPKSGFGAPLRAWLKHELKGYVEDMLSPSSLRNRGLFDVKTVQLLIAHDSTGRIDASYPIFALICIELWCRLFVDRVSRDVLSR